MKNTMNELSIGFVEGEKVILTFRKHWFYLFPSLLVVLFGFVLLAVFIAFSPQLTDDSILNFEVVFTVVVVFLALVFALATRGYLNWYYNIYQITNKRIIVLNLTIRLRFKISETIFQLVKSAEETRPGFLGSILNYGHIKVATDNIANSAIFNIRYVREPERVMQIIQKLIVHKNA